MKVCTKCSCEKPFSEFSKRASSKDGYTFWCKPCKKQYDKSYFEENREKVLEANKKYKKRNPDKWVHYSKVYYQENKEVMRLQNKEARIKAKYGVTCADVERLLAEQNSQCEICREDITDCYVIDHNHASGEVRGLLCFNCNTALGGFKDSPEILRSAFSYLNTKGYYG